MAHCCEQMRSQLGWSCTEHPSSFDCPDCLVTYIEKFDEYGLIIHDGGWSFLEINFCPWCGAKLPESKRAEWFTRLEAIGIESDDDEPPDEFKSGAWWRGTDL